MEKIKGNKEIKALENQGYFLNSCIAMMKYSDAEPESWTLTYFSNATELVSAVNVNNGVDVKQPARATSKTTRKLDLKQVKVFDKNVLEKSKQAFEKGFRTSSKQIILTLSHTGNRLLWSANFVTPNLELVIIKTDAETGEAISKTKESLTAPV